MKRPAKLARRLALAAALAAAACAVDQDAEVALYRGVLDEVVPQPAALDPASPLSLRGALALANRNNEQLAAAGEDYVQAMIRKRRIAARFLPAITFAPSYAIEDTPVGVLSGQALSYRRVGGNVQRFEAPVSADVNLYNGGGDAASMRAADAVITQQRELLLDAQASLLLDVARVYFAVLRAERSAQVLQSALQLQDARVVDAERQLRNGLATTLTVAQFQAQREATRASVVAAEGDARDARLALAVLIGVPEVAGPLAEGFVMPGDRPDLAACEHKAEDVRQDLHAARAAIVAARENVEVAVAQYYPSLSLDVTAFLYREHPEVASMWSALLSLNLPLFTGGRIHADVREAWSRWRQANLDESLVHRRVLRDVRGAHNALRTADERLVALRSEVAAASDALRLAQSAFGNGLATTLDVLAAQDRLLAAQLDATAAEFDQAVAWLEILRTTGDLPTFAATR
jgi:outer membrane protein